MKLYYDPSSGKIFYAIHDNDLFGFSHTTNIPLNEMNIDEIEENKEICIDLKKYVKPNRVNVNGEEKYYILNGQLELRDGWEEYTEDV